MERDTAAVHSDACEITRRRDAPSRTSHAPVVPDVWETGPWAVRTRRRLIYALWLVALSLALSVMPLACRLEAGAVLFPTRLVSAPRRVSKPRPTTTQAT